MTKVAASHPLMPERMGRMREGLDSAGCSCCGSEYCSSVGTLSGVGFCGVSWRSLKANADERVTT